MRCVARKLTCPRAFERVTETAAEKGDAPPSTEMALTSVGESLTTTVRVPPTTRTSRRCRHSASGETGP